MLTEEEWYKREQELIDCVLKALAQEPEEPMRLSVKAAASIDGAFIPSMSGDCGHKKYTPKCLSGCT